MWTCITTVWLIVLLTYTYVYTFFMRGHFSHITYVTSDAFHVRRNLCHAVLPWLDDQPTTHIEIYFSHGYALQPMTSNL